MLFAEASRLTRAFQVKTRLTCPEGCGSCCASPFIETTELELLPLADELIRKGKAETCYDKAEAREFRGQCIFYNPAGKGGCCEAYHLRPLICRLFAYSGNRDKYGRIRLVTCKIIKEADPVLAEKALADVASGKIIPPVMSGYIMQASSLDPELSHESLPINTAFKKAVERLGLSKKLNSQKDKEGQ